MFYLAANNSRIRTLHARGFPIGMMMSPKGYRRPRGVPFACDNGLFVPFGTPPKPPEAIAAFYAMLKKLEEKPMFVVVPDVPYDAAATIELAHHHLPTLARTGHNCAFAVQDGMQTHDVPPAARTIFVAGSTAWKWKTAPMWCDFARASGRKCHIARVNTRGRIRQCQDIGADSADGTGIWRGDQDQLRGVLDALVQPALWE